MTGLLVAGLMIVGGVMFLFGGTTRAVFAFKNRSTVALELFTGATAILSGILLIVAGGLIGLLALGQLI